MVRKSGHHGGFTGTHPLFFRSTFLHSDMIFLAVRSAANRSTGSCLTMSWLRRYGPRRMHVPPMASTAEPAVKLTIRQKTLSHEGLGTPQS